MPLRSVEAATRDDAIAAAREEFGPAARVVGVRRVRSGGVLGFFATERYVAEVAPDPIGVPGVPLSAPARPAGALTEDPDTGSLAAYGSPLASAATARARTAPPRNGAAAWAAEAARPSAPAVPQQRPGARTAPRPFDDDDFDDFDDEDDARVDELAGLLDAPAAIPVERSFPASATGAPVARAGFPRTTRETTPAARDEGDAGDLPEVTAPATAAPSPFTAALARMVAGDRDVQHAVREALQSADAARPGDEHHELEAPRPEQQADGRTAVRSRAAFQEEETVGDQVIAPPSTSTDERAGLNSRTAEPPFRDESAFRDEVSFRRERPFAAEPSFAMEPSFAVEPTRDSEPDDAVQLPVVSVDPPVVTEGAASREEAIARVLRVALAEGHSDDALAGILRKVVAGDSPQDALAEPIAVWEPVAEATVPEPVAAEPVAPVVDTLPSAHFALFPAPAATASTGPVQLWGRVSIAPSAMPSAPTPIWGEPGPAASADADADADTADVAPAPEAEATDVPVAAAEKVIASALDAELAPLLARTASDPAPVGTSMSMDATTVMPPLSLLPGAPSRGRGLPPVPARVSRPPVPPSLSGPSPAATPASGAPDPDAPSPARSAPRSLATVTRLPVAPLMATPETPDLPELADLAELIEDDGSDLFGPPAPPVLPTRPARVRIDPPSTPEEVLSRLAALGVPADLLGPAFTADVAADGTYAALTRALGDRLPEAPELPTGAGDVLFVVGPGVETLRAARSLAATLRLDPDRVQWATRGDLVGLVPESSRTSTIDTALSRRQDASTCGTVTIVAVDAPLRTDAYWMSQMLAIWSPVAVWAVVEATRKPEDIEHWVEGLARVDALMVQDTDLSADPAAVLARLAVPVAVVDGVRATPHRWASVLCERLETAPA